MIFRKKLDGVDWKLGSRSLERAVGLWQSESFMENFMTIK